MGCDDLLEVVRRGAAVVSIHAPAWGATKIQLLLAGKQAGFNPRTRVGCDIDVFTRRKIAGSKFQSTHPRGVRRLPAFAADLFPDVSIHAPAWGATRAQIFAARHPVCFNPRTRVGCDPSPALTRPPYRLFQSTHPRGVRRNPASSRASPSRFQSTHPRGVRQARHGREQVDVWVSIHAPAWGATADGRAARRAHRSFNPRTRVGCDKRSRPRPTPSRLFQSTHPRGVRLFPCFIQ